MSEKKGNSTWVNLDDIRSLFSEEEIEARKREIMEKMELKRKEDIEAKELMKQERQALKDKGWDSSAIGQELRVNPDVEQVIEEVIKEVIEPEWSIDEHMKKDLELIDAELAKEPEIDPKDEKIKKLEEQMAIMNELLKDVKKEEGE